MLTPDRYLSHPCTDLLPVAHAEEAAPVDEPEPAAEVAKADEPVEEEEEEPEDVSLVSQRHNAGWVREGAKTGLARAGWIGWRRIELCGGTNANGGALRHRGSEREPRTNRKVVESSC